MSATHRIPSTMPVGPMLFMVGLLQIAKRIGLAKPMVRMALNQMISEERKKRAFAGYVPTEHDVFVATFAKSGTNWMMQIAQQIAHRGEGEYGHIHEVVAWPDAPMPGTLPLDDPGPLAGSPTGRRVIKTHLETEYLPYREEAAYLTILRDPKEVLVSAYYFLGGILGVLSHLSIDDWFELGMQPRSLMTGWAHHTHSYWQWRDRPNALVVGFGAVKREPRNTIARAAEVMGVDLTAAQLDRVLERSGFDYMKAHESQFDPPRLPFGSEEDRPRMVRSGKSGDSGEVLSRAQQAAIDRLCQRELEKLGSDFPYAEMFEVVSDAGT